MITPDKKLKIGDNSYCIAEFGKWDDPEATNHLPHNSRRYAGQARALAQIDIVVRAIAKGSMKPFKMKTFVNGTMKKVPTTQGTRLLNIIPLVGYFDSIHDYSETIAAFLISAWAIERKYQTSLSKIVGFQRSRHDQCVSAIEDMVAMIRNASAQDWYMRCKSDREYRSKIRRSDQTISIPQVLDIKYQSLVIRIDLTFQKHARKYLTIDDVFVCVDSLRERLKKGSAEFNNLVDYEFCIEQGRGMGYHLHAYLVFDGKYHQNYDGKARQIANLWLSLTEGRGHFYICYPDQYGENCGIGMIRRDDRVKIQHSVRAATYLAKSHEKGRKRPSFLMMKPHGARTYWTGIMAESTRSISSDAA